MFRGSYQRKLLTILYSGGSNPLEIWSIQVRNGWTRRLKDDDMGTIVFEVAGTNVATAFIVSPPDPKAVLGISLPFVTMVIKNLKRYFTFEIQILDDKKMRRRFRFSNYQSTTKVRPFTCSVPLSLKPGWNQMQLNLANFTMRAYGTNYMETQRVQIHANCRIRRVFFSDRIYAETELPREYRIQLNPRAAPQQTASKQMMVQDSASQKDHASLSSKAAPILKQSIKTEGVLGPGDGLVTQTSLKTIPSTVERQSVKSETSGAATRSTSTRKSVQRISMERKSIGATESVTSRRTLKSMDKSNEAVKGVTFTLTEDNILEGDEGSDDLGIDMEHKKEETETTEDLQQVENGKIEEVEESLEPETPRTELTDSEFAELESGPQSDTEDLIDPLSGNNAGDEIAIGLNEHTEVID